MSDFPVNDPCPVRERFYLPYLAFFEDADRRTKKGQRQGKCSTCKRWRWKDHRDACATAMKEPQHG